MKIQFTRTGRLFFNRFLSINADKDASIFGHEELTRRCLKEMSKNITPGTDHTEFKNFTFFVLDPVYTREKIFSYRIEFIEGIHYTVA